MRALIVRMSEDALAVTLVLAIVGEWVAIGLIYLHHARRDRLQECVDVNKPGRAEVNECSNTEC